MNGDSFIYLDKRFVNYLYDNSLSNDPLLKISDWLGGSKTDYAFDRTNTIQGPLREKNISPIPEFDVPDDVFILRYSYDVNSKIDQLAAWPSLFIDFIKNSDWEKYYDEFVMEMVQNLPESMVEKNVRVIVLCSDIENLVLKDKFVK